ncbi:NADH-quinone oxidoreductase subunit L [Alkalisalibacterium limincola]|uniref:NADH-quinone oxidoreductase subunit L n=1 Tax=Alkalisalibacterium limincola TaxID=2699169 RepID=A0A5C8KWY6_9GAMM|nr:NADH-quinone oxidoreductase subunit L [Alkalisalibacterium limincola]TXK65740.1 NADH-quinone oxidoreductase subunit L [Alkalisalibacterium limincola]
MLSQTTLLIIALAPLLGAIIAGLFGRQVGRAGAHTVTILGVGVSCALSIQVLYQLVWGGAAVFNENIYTWFEVGSISAHVGFLVDELTAMMMVVVTFVSLLVHVYTIGYMKDDPGYQRFFSYISLFTFSMLMLVMANNFLQLFFGWEAVGLVSYLLIGFWFKKPSAIFANLKAFLVNRVGDFGFLLGIGGVLFWLGSLDYATVFAAAPALEGVQFTIWPGMDWEIMTFICICLFIGAMGKSAQVPLHVWLPDSMEGPTPISALIHAATMVTAGIFMVARMSPLFELSPTALLFVLVIGATTAFFTGLIGIVQNDIKRVVAYSTLSQLGYMTVALGVSAYAGAVFHLMTHAFFKALLFLAAGSVIIGMHHQQDMLRMGGLRKYMPITYIATVIGTLALVGFPFLSGYYSKDVIIEAVAEVAGNGPIQMYAYIAVLLGVFVTSFYSFRLLYLTFHGRERFRDAEAETHAGGHDDVSEGAAHAEAEAGHGAHAHDDHGHDGHGVHEPHESPWVVTLPLILLAIPSIAIGFLTAGPMLFGDFFANAVFVREANDTIAMVGERLFTSAVGFGLHFYASPAFWLAFAGFAVATYVYLFNPALATKTRNALRVPVKVLENKYGFDKLWVEGFAGGGIKLGEQLSRRLDAGLIDGVLVNGSAAVVDRIAAISRRVQSGYLYHYAFAMIIGLIVMLGFLIRMLG